MADKVTGHWVDSKEDRYFINKNGNKKWFEYQKGKAYCTFDFVRYDDNQSVVIFDPGRNFYVKITDDVLMWSYDPNKVTNVFGRGSWKIKPSTNNAPTIPATAPNLVPSRSSSAIATSKASTPQASRQSSARSVKNMEMATSSVSVESVSSVLTNYRQTMPEKVQTDLFIGKNFKDGRYDIKKKIGSGGFGRVYMGYDNVENNNKAVKIITSIDLESDDDDEDIKLLKMIKSDYVIKLFDYFRENFLVFIVLEYCQYGDLASVIHIYKETNKKLDAKKAYEWICQGAKGLRDIHSMKIIHRDVKPDNMFLTDDENIKLGDLGVAKWIQTTMKNTSAGTFTGTLEYLSPEMIAQKPCSYNSDIWSLGCVAYELFLLKKAFPNPFKDQSVNHLDFGNSQITPIVKKMLQENPSNRPSSAQICDYLEEMKKQIV